MTPEPERLKPDTPNTCRHFPSDVEHALHTARQQHPDLHSLHESFAVLYEEVDEFWNIVKLQSNLIGRRPLAYIELTHIAALCQRIAEDILLKQSIPATNK